MPAARHRSRSSFRERAVKAMMGRWPPRRPLPLAHRLGDLNGVVRFHAAISLGDLGSGGRPAVAALTHTSLWDEDPAVRVEAAMALWKIDRKLPLVLHVLTNALEDANELICWIAAERLAQLGPVAREAVPALRKAMKRDLRVSHQESGVSRPGTHRSPRGSWQRIEMR
jgi:HEAT repeat protein